MKLSKKVSRNSENELYVPEWTRYAGNFIYNENATGETLQFFNHPEGYVEPDGKGAFNYVYQYKDHLGNIRLSYKDQDKDGKITGATTTVFSDDFEYASGWDGSGASWGWPITGFDSDFKYQGNYSGEVKAPQGQARVSHSNVWVPINNTEDTDYIYSAWAYSESPIIRLGLAMKEDGETGYLTLFDDKRVYTTKKWVYIEKRVTVPAHITSLNMRIESAAWGNRVGSVWYDNVSIKKVNDTDDIEIVEENNYYPFGLKHKGYNGVINGTDHKYGYNGKEENEELGLNWLDFGARNYEVSLGRWMNTDPLAEGFYSYSPYNSMMNNPINFIDPTGMSAEWIPEVDENTGAVSYIAEDGDSASTLQSQYGLDDGVAERIIGDREIEAGDSVSGKDVSDANGGNQILKLDLTSKEGKSGQRRFDQFLFANDLTKAYGGTSFHPADYYTNRFAASSSLFGGQGALSGTAFINVDGESLELDFQLELYTTNRYAERNGFEIETQAFSRKGLMYGQRFPGNTENLEYNRIATFGKNKGKGYSSGNRLTIKHNQVNKYLKRLNRSFKVDRSKKFKL